ncbi:MAG: 2-amino-4-hydroxy-6-hydroxymethyldihydropteridine diphosphokinase [Pseudomonadales bacterium]|nr:2-amino-4-hydroxy-6-hydroxymethyldihydropteridine diphosphokinase [Pseudomonadales bacterium]
MSRVALSIGSNIDAPHYIALALEALSRRYGKLTTSSIYESEAVGFVGGNFLNLVVLLETEQALAELNECLKTLEAEHGRRQGQPRFSARTLDIDVLCYGDLQGKHGGIQLPRAEITQNAFVLQPLAEVAGAELHPPTGKTYAQLWQAYDKSRQRLWPIDFEWRGELISRRG